MNSPDPLLGSKSKPKLNLVQRLFYWLKHKVFKRNLTKNFRWLYLTRVVVNSASQLLGLFLPIFLYFFLDFNLSLVIIYYVILDLSFALLVPYACSRAMNSLGIKKSLQLSVFFGAASYLLFSLLEKYFVGTGDASLGWRFIYLIPTIFFFLLYRLTHWVPYHTSFAKLTDKYNRARQFSFTEATVLAMGAIMPMIAGVILTYFNYSILFLLGMVVYLLALIPITRLPEIKEKYTWNYRETAQQLFSKKFRPYMLAFAGDGAESIVSAVIWPVFIWRLLEGDFLQLGLISSLIVIATIILQAFVGGPLDKIASKKTWLRYGVIFYSFGWILKSLSYSALHIFLFSSYHNISKIFSHTSFDVLNYDIAADQGRHVDEYTAMREISIVIGKVSMSILALILIPLFSWRIILLLGAFTVLLMTLLKHGEVVKSPQDMT